MSIFDFIKKPLGATLQSRLKTGWPQAKPEPDVSLYAKGKKPGETFNTPDGKTYKVDSPSIPQIADTLWNAANPKQPITRPDFVLKNTTPIMTDSKGPEMKLPFKQENIPTPFGPILGTGIKTAFEFPERIVQTVADIYNQSVHKDLNDDAVFQKGNLKVADAFSESAAMQEEAINNGMSESHAKALATLYGVSTIIADLGSVADLAARGALAFTKFNRPLDEAIVRLGMNAESFSVDVWAKNTQTALQNALKTGDEEAIRQLVGDYKTIAGSLKTGTATKVDGPLKFIQDTAKKITEPIGGKNVAYDLSRAGEESIPGYRPQYGPTPAMGMSVNPIEPVGFGKPNVVPADATDFIAKNPIVTPKENAVDFLKKPIKEAVNLPPVFTGFSDISTNILTKLNGRRSVSKQFIEDLTKGQDIKQAEREIILEKLADYPKDVPVKEFAEKVKAELLPLKRQPQTRTNPEAANFGSKYEGIALPDDLRGNIQNYSENIYQSPIKTSAGDIHFGSGERNYFGHTRVEDLGNLHENAFTGEMKMADDGDTRRVIEVQSDLYQKGNLDEHAGTYDFSYLKEMEANKAANKPYSFTDYKNLKAVEKNLKENPGINPTKLRQYNDPTAHFRMVREEIKQAALDGKTKLQFPTGETAMKIEGLGDARTWSIGLDDSRKLKIEDLKVGESVYQASPEDMLHGAGDQAGWIVTDVLGDGKFKAIPANAPENYELFAGPSDFAEHIKSGKPLPEEIASAVESFDISGKVGTNNPIYKFYEKDLGKYLKNKYGAQLVTDPQGVKWYEVPVKEEMGGEPVVAFSTKGDTAYDLTVPEATEILNKLFDKKEVSFIFEKHLIDGHAVGMFSNKFVNLIKLVEKGGKVRSQTLFHEAFHAYMETFMTASERAAMVKKVLETPALKASLSVYSDKTYPTPEAKAKEWLADDFADYVKWKAGGEEHKSIFSKIWDSIMQKVRSWIRKVNKFQKTYDEILSKKRTGFKEKATSKGSAKFQSEGSPLDRKIDELKTEQQALEDSIANDPAKSLVKYANKNRELPEVLGRMQSNFGTSGDDIVTELGFTDTNDARLAYDNLKLKVKRLNNLKEDIATITTLRAKGRLEDKDAKSLKFFLNQQTKLSDQEVQQMVRRKTTGTAKRSPLQKLIDERNTTAREHLENLLEATYKTLAPIEQERAITAPELLGTPIGVDDLSKISEGDPFNKIVLDMRTPVKNKVGIIDYLRTPDRVLKKIGLESFNKPVRFAYESYLAELPDHIDLIKSWKDRASEAGAEKRIFDWLDGQQNRDYYSDKVIQPLGKKELEVALEIKTYLEEWASRLGLPADNRISHYITHIFEVGENEIEFDEDVAKIIKDQVAGEVYDPFLQKRLGKKGYIRDVWQALDAYVKRGVRKANMDPVLERLKAASSRLEDSGWSYIKRYVDRINLRPTEIDNLLDNTFKQWFGYKFGQRPVATITRGARRAISRFALGLNFSSAIRNLTQGVNIYAELGEKYTAIGYMNLMTQGAGELNDLGILGQDMIQDQVLSATGKIMEKADKVLFFNFKATELVNRGAAYYGAKAKALAEGKTLQEAVDYAKRLVRDTQFQFGSIDTPVGLNSDVAKTLTQFLTFGIKQLEFGVEKIQARDWAGIIRYILASAVIIFAIGETFNIQPSDFIPGYFLINPSKNKFGAPTLALPQEIVKAIFNTPDKYGHPRDLEDKLIDVAETVPIPAGVQGRRTFQGLSDYMKGRSVTKSGKTRFTVDDNLVNLAKSALLGRYSTPEGKEYIEKLDGKSLVEKALELVTPGKKSDLPALPKLTTKGAKLPALPPLPKLPKLKKLPTIE